MTAADWIRALGLEPHPEGGHYRETYRSGLLLRPEGFEGERAACTAIYYLLERSQCSALHRIRSDEAWHLYAGGPLEIHVFDSGGEYERILLGSDPSTGAGPQAVVPAGAWFGATVAGGEPYALAGCTVSPGFDFRDFELAGRRQALEWFPRHRSIVERLTPVE